MTTYPNEEKRLLELYSLNILDTETEQDFDDVSRIAAIICDTPISLITLLDKDRQWFKSRYGLSLLETPRDISFCTHAIQKPDELMEVENTLNDPRFKDNPLVLDQPEMRFYAGMPIVTSGGLPLGTVCVIDQRPRKLSYDQREALMALSRLAMKLIYKRLLKEELTKVRGTYSSRVRELIELV